MKQKEIRLKDLLIEVLLRWRVLLVWMIVGAIVLGAYGYANAVKAENEAVAKNEEIKAKIEQQRQEIEKNEDAYANKGNMTLEYLTSKLDATQQGNVNNVLAYESYIKARKEYMGKSIIMQMEATAIPQVELTFSVLSDDMDKNCRIERIYEDLIAGGLYRYIEERNKDISSEQAAEIVTITRSTAGLINGGDSFEVRVRGLTEEQSKTLAQNVIDYINSKHDTIEATMGSHSIEAVNNEYSVAMDYSVQSSQITSRNELVTWENNVAEWKEKFSEDEERYYNFITNGEATTADNADDTGSIEQNYQFETVTPASVSAKKVVFGMALFAFLYLCYIVLSFIFDNKLRAYDEVDNLFGVPYLGIIQCRKQKRKLFDFVDRWIYKLRDYGKRKFSEKESLGLAAVAVKIATEKENLGRVLCVGCDIKDDTAEVCNKVAQELKRDNIETVILNNILYNQDSLGRLGEAKAAFLVETADDTMYEEIVKELDLLKRQEISILGILVVE